jgi:hypothetical protein
MRSAHAKCEVRPPCNKTPPGPKKVRICSYSSAIRALDGPLRGAGSVGGPQGLPLELAAGIFSNYKASTSTDIMLGQCQS